MTGARSFVGSQTAINVSWTSVTPQVTEQTILYAWDCGEKRAARRSEGRTRRHTETRAATVVAPACKRRIGPVRGLPVRPSPPPASLVFR